METHLLINWAIFITFKKYWKVIFNIFPKYLTSQWDHTKIFIIFGVLFNSTQNKQIIALFKHFCKIENFHFQINCHWQVGHPCRHSAPRSTAMTGGLTADISPPMRLPATARVLPCSPPHSASVDGTSWTKNGSVWARRRPWRPWWRGCIMPVK